MFMEIHCAHCNEVVAEVFSSSGPLASLFHPHCAREVEREEEESSDD